MGGYGQKCEKMPKSLHLSGQWCAAPFLFWQDLPNSYWW